ncbi:Sgo1p Ecym_4043 [Eremothecium cymbalariae DBVPG|uniref:Shugoshin C-terminal domain-containing protein n=1 Tax=Eremothecium cymbalariae (strain CBS 270.75 / DBVPG 7215 / KCTC 17166 / NRRL Y-17582) TaxID=931890 RepID=G8JSX1_ERECY|nr:hypothetical protein Ecym_4043 [Eremothecium cymbalariae DBVPG\
MGRALKRTGRGKQQSNSVQEYLDLISLQKQQFEQMRSNYTQQNSQLAKSNSMLMIKVADLETKISELVQENVQLRSRVSVTELKFKERLNESFNLLEHDVLQRFDDVVNLFTVIREQQGLQECGIANKKSTLKRFKNTEYGISSPKVVEFNVPINKDNCNNHTESTNEVECSNQQLNDSSSIEINLEETQPLKKKRRKSSRRESLFIPSDFDFSNDSLENALKDFESPKPTDEDRRSIATGTINEEMNHDDIDNEHMNSQEAASMQKTQGLRTTELEEDEREEELDEEILDAEKDLRDDNQHDETANFTHSIIEYFIPEEEDESAEVSNTSKSKLEVYKDNKEKETTFVVATNLQDHSELISSKMPFVQIPLSSQSKIKHSMKPPRLNQRKIVVDEVMPQNGYNDSTRPRRTRGKAVDYKWPSLRAKMRRPTDKLVDATTVTDIHELQVTTNRRLRKSKGVGSARCEELNHSKSLHKEENSIDDNRNRNEAEVNEQEHIEEQIISENNEKNKIVLQLPPVLKERRINESPIRKPMVLKDITNKRYVNQKNKKVLSKKPIVGDISDENSYYIDESSKSSFRLSEDDLSVFDLIGGAKCSSMPKTHRARAKAERQGIKKVTPFKV